MLATKIIFPSSNFFKRKQSSKYLPDILHNKGFMNQISRKKLFWFHFYLHLEKKLNILRQICPEQNILPAPCTW